MRTFLIVIASLVVGAGLGVFSYSRIVPAPNDVFARAEAFQPDNRDWLLQNMSEVYPTRTIARGQTGAALPRREGALEGFTYVFDGSARDLTSPFTDMEATGLIILHKGAVLHESYGRGAGPATRFASWSVAKSITSTLVGLAVQDGFIDSVDDQLTKYLPDLSGTPYDGVTIKQALQMSSGIEFDKDIWQGDLSDTVKFMTDTVITQKKRAFEVAATFKRTAEPGTVFNYNSAESQILIELVREVTGASASAYLERKIWQPLGMVHDAAWIIDHPSASGAEMGGMMFNAALIDWARFGLFIEQDGVWDGQALLPPGWVDQASVSDEAHLRPGSVHPNPNRGYAWHWWTYPDGTFTASGANGQAIYIDRENDIVVARTSSWPEGYVAEYDDHYYALYKALADWLAENQ